MIRLNNHWPQDDTIVDSWQSALKKISHDPNVGELLPYLQSEEYDSKTPENLAGRVLQKRLEMQRLLLGINQDGSGMSQKTNKPR